MSNINNDEEIQLKWPHLSPMFKQITKTCKDKNIEFQCLLCIPTKKYLSTSISSYSNLRKHISVSSF